MKIVKKMWGAEHWIINTERYCGKLLILKKGWRSSLHYHNLKDESFYINRGRVLMEVDGRKWVMKKGDCVRILPNSVHRFTGLKKSEIFEFSTHHDDSDTYRRTQSEKV